ncbi:MAG: hypothetical protein WCF57_14585 [Pyrinomonadaceae bacterium]
MANTPDLATCISAAEENGELLPLSPFYALNYHFGMLLGVDDFETEQAYHRSKMRLHNAWLHREGVVWGMDVRLGEMREEIVEGKKTETLDLSRGEIRVTSGLALDAAGHELHLETDACLNVAQWFEAHSKDADFSVTDEGNGIISFDAHVVIRFKACLTRQVPALSEPCDGAGTDTAYSRIFETLEIELRPGLAPDRTYPYHRLRLLFNLEAPILDEDDTTIESDQEVLDERASILALPLQDQPAAYLRAFRRFAALDEIDLRPATSKDGNRLLLFPATDDEPLVLANVAAIKLDTKDKKAVLLGGETDVTVRPSHVATSTIQELLCGPLFEGDEPSSPPDAVEGPSVDPATIEMEAFRIRLRFDRDLHQASVNPEAFSVTWFNEAEGWHNVIVGSATYEAADRLVNLELKHELGGKVRLIVRGTGPTPLLGADLVPLAGGLPGVPVTKHDGHDFVYMKDFTPEGGEELKAAGVKEGY